MRVMKVTIYTMPLKLCQSIDNCMILRAVYPLYAGSLTAVMADSTEADCCPQGLLQARVEHGQV